MGFKLTILGSNSAKPVYGRFTTAQYLDLGPEAILIDAGEGVQLQIAKFGLKPNKISKIVISHLHGDHILGLPGLLGSFNLSSRTKELNIYSPPGLEKWINVLNEISESQFGYTINFHQLELSVYKTIFKNEQVEIAAFPVVHRIPTCGFLFREVNDTINIDPSKIEKYQLTIPEIKEIKSGLDIIKDGKRITHESLILNKKEKVSYAFCADTMYTESFLDVIKNVDLLYHEATYLHELADKAKERKHSTAYEAAMIATKANVKKLLIGHYSSRYKDVTPLLAEARGVFKNTLLAIEGEEHIL